jgi:hypothetical protein
MRPDETPDEPPTESIRSFRAHMAHRLDQGKVVRITRRGVPIGHYVPINQPVPIEPDEIEPEDEALPDDDGSIVLATVTADAGPRWHTLWTSSHLGLQAFLGEID